MLLESNQTDEGTRLMPPRVWESQWRGRDVLVDDVAGESVLPAIGMARDAYVDRDLHDPAGGP